MKQLQRQLITTTITHINTTAGAHTGTINETDGVNGQIKIITMIVKGGSNNSVVTPTNLTGTQITFDV